MLKIRILMYNCFYKTIACYSVVLAYCSVPNVEVLLQSFHLHFSVCVLTLSGIFMLSRYQTQLPLSEVQLLSV